VINECYWIKKHPLVSVENVHSSLGTEYKAKRIDEKLFYMSVALKDPYLAYSLKWHIGNAIEYGKTIGKIT